MHAVNNARKLKGRSRGRPKGSMTRFPGSCTYAASIGKDKSHVSRVLRGDRISPSLLHGYVKYIKSLGMGVPEGLPEDAYMESK